MRSRHILLVALVAAIWGLNFVVIRIGLGSFPPLLLAALRFGIAATPALLLPPPSIPGLRLLAVAMSLFVGQFAFLFTGIAIGMPPGLASAAVQMQAFLTILVAALFLGERPTRRQITGTALAFVGLLLIVSTVGRDGLTPWGLVLTLFAALSWAVGNVLLRGAGKVDMLAMVAWLSVIPPAPLFLLSLLIEGPSTIGNALRSVNLSGLASVGYLGLCATVVGYGFWGYLLKLYPASTVAPFALLVPIFGMTFATLILGETFSLQRLAGSALIVSGLGVISPPRVEFNSKWLRIILRS